MGESLHQLNMRFGEKHSLLYKKLHSGEFVVLLETDLPLQEQPFEPAVETGRILMKTAEKNSMAGGVVLTDRLQGEECHDPVNVAEEFKNAADMPLVLTVSGRNMTTSQARDVTARARGAGVDGYLFVTGDRDKRHQRTHGSRRMRRRQSSAYLDSDEMIARFNDSPRPLIGAAVNPFKYTAEDQYLQYYKAVRKLATGADFLVTQAGWDMRKLQDLQWYLQMRELDVPVIARVPLLSLHEIQQIHSGYLPGVPLPRSFAALLQREADISANQSLSAQLHRIGLQVAGCRLLGFSGVQLRGLQDARTADMVLEKVNEALDTYTDYPSWREAWETHHRDLNFAPVHSGFYTFRKASGAEQAMYNPKVCKLEQGQFRMPAKKDVLSAAANRVFYGKQVPAFVSERMKHVLCPACAGRDDCRLAYAEYLCPKACPKELVYGPCGNSSTAGMCEFGHKECFFHRVLALAYARRELDDLESGIDID